MNTTTLLSVSHCCQIIIREGYHVGIVTNITVNKMAKRREVNILSTLRGEAEKLEWNVRRVGIWYSISVASLQLGENFTNENTCTLVSCTFICYFEFSSSEDPVSTVQYLASIDAIISQKWIGEKCGRNWSCTIPKFDSKEKQMGFIYGGFWLINRSHWPPGLRRGS